MVLVGGRSGKIYGLFVVDLFFGFKQCDFMASADAELERLLKETGKQLSLPHDYVDELLQVLDLVDILDEGIISPDLGTLDYKGPYKVVGKALLRIHAEGQRKSVITPMSKLCCGA
ncbi:hypothetical protein HanXRQr2_Chr06g0268671 [Helianthus annuus]|nr:hypothetical protein HanXRQr2_Chr06g0268671 [Helianthus annuus]